MGKDLNSLILGTVGVWVCFLFLSFTVLGMQWYLCYSRTENQKVTKAYGLPQGAIEAIEKEKVATDHKAKGPV